VAQGETRALPALAFVVSVPGSRPRYHAMDQHAPAGRPRGHTRGPAGNTRDGRASGSRSRSGRRVSTAPHVCHREVPHFMVVPGQLLGPRRQYVVRRQLGEGTFGRVLSCVDALRREAVAVKIVKGVRRYCEYAEAEAEVLREISRCDPGRQSRCVQLRDTFVHAPLHYCLVFERLGVSLHEFMHKSCDQGLLVTDVRGIAQQLLQCLCFLHGFGVTHTDLKCRNVMLRDPRYEVVALPRGGKDAETRKPRSNEIVVIDFGGALFAAERGDGKIGTRHYRSPEVVVGLPWDEKADLWSAGCLVALTYLGFRPISASEDFEQLALMERLLGKELPRPMAREALSRGTVSSGTLFNKAGRLEWPKRAPDIDAVGRVQKARPLREQVCTHHHALLELLEALLQFDPKRRSSAEVVSELPFIAGEVAVME